MVECKGCLDEMRECYNWQMDGYDAGLNWYGNHCCVFVIDVNGRFIIE